MRPSHQVTGRIGAFGRMNRTGDSWEEASFRATGRKVSALAPSPWIRITVASGDGPVSNSTAGAIRIAIHLRLKKRIDLDGIKIRV